MLGDVALEVLVVRACSLWFLVEDVNEMLSTRYIPLLDQAHLCIAQFSASFP